MTRILIAATICAGLAFSTSAPLAATTAEEEYARACAGILNFIPRIVRRETVAAIGPDSRVVVHSICRGVDLNDFGNAGGLTRTITQNPVLSRALARNGYRPDEVVGINPIGGTVHLYVHRD